VQVSNGHMVTSLPGRSDRLPGYYCVKCLLVVMYWLVLLDATGYTIEGLN